MLLIRPARFAGAENLRAVEEAARYVGLGMRIFFPNCRRESGNNDSRRLVARRGRRAPDADEEKQGASARKEFNIDIRHFAPRNQWQRQ
jgi:hypothetical protein